MFFSRNHAKIKVDLFNFLPLEKALTIHNVIKLFKSIFDKNHNHYYYTLFLVECSYQLSKSNNSK